MTYSVYFRGKCYASGLTYEEAKELVGKFVGCEIRPDNGVVMISPV